MPGTRALEPISPIVIPDDDGQVSDPDRPVEEVLVRAARFGAGDGGAADGFDGFLDESGRRGRTAPMDPEGPLPQHRI